MKKLVKPTRDEMAYNNVEALIEACTCREKVCGCQNDTCGCNTRRIFSDTDCDDNEILF